MIGQFQLLQMIPPNYAVSSHRQPPHLPLNSAVLSRPPKFNDHQPCLVNYTNRVKWNGNKPKRRNDKRRVNSNDSSETNRFTGKVRKFHFPKRRFTSGGRMPAPFAPCNTTSFIIRAKKSGGIASLVSPCARTPAILTTPILSPSTEVVVEMAKEKWGVDGYGTMNGLIRVRSRKESSNETENNDSEQFEVEKTLNTHLRRFEMICPSEYSLENRVDEQELKISRLEEHNLTLKERVFLIERELNELRRRVLCLETEGIRLQDFNREDVCSDKSVSDDGESDDKGDC
ncbi:uncharacterized protein LOC131638838 [Vicia villosa]|uniref:uncharacterized protein LOC131638838 n=1 Tax=Vicia villosa TaxID=3911 RepID=UPI00273BD2AF|nr:uncharacterized protein LOC131638838 [Vicia villosa]